MSFPIYLTGAEKDRDDLQRYAQALDTVCTSTWFQTNAQKPDSPVTLVDAIKKACKAVLILPQASAIEGLKFELGALAACNYSVCVLYQDDAVRQRLPAFLPRLKLYFYKEFEPLKRHIEHWMQDRHDYWD